MGDFDEKIVQLKNALVIRDRKSFMDLTGELVEKGIDTVDLIERGFRAGMEEVGGKFEALEIFIPDMIEAAEIMEEGLRILRPILEKKKELKTLGRVVLGTIQGDVHEIGKNIVKIMLQGAGFEVIDLGRDVEIMRFVDCVKEKKPDLVGISALMTNTMVNIPKVIECLRELGLRDNVKVMVGGAPVLEEWALKIGADGYGENAMEAVGVAKKLLNIKN
ncbi:dimethylamine corrinoid protein 3 [Candidatus Aerophobetes bacterium]|uniref:Dimethylamine corrinoid protein 3 n=1 Tax=Aerophobetes bacterium TaxID=2030807 RepID=A0A662DAE1_UNCAE|nr:MAG: dimethylamine corrinoid protein 3 [Candidatus Aerophobetes bacterium]